MTWVLEEIGVLGWLSILLGLGLAVWFWQRTLLRRPSQKQMLRFLLLGAVPLALGVLSAGLRFQSLQIELQRQGAAWTGLSPEMRDNWVERFLLNVWVGVAATLVAWWPLWLAKVRWKRFD